MKGTRLWPLALLVAVGVGSYLLTRMIAAGYPKDGSISGTVVDDQGTPVEGAAVWCEFHPESDENGDDEASDSDKHRDWTRSDAKGGFAFEAVRPGTYTVGAEDNEHLDAQERSVDVRPGKTVSGISLVMKQGTAIAGQVTDWDGNPVPDAEVSGRPKGLYSPGHESVTDMGGAFVVRGLEPGLCHLGAYATGFFPFDKVLSVPAEGVTIRLRRLPTVKGRVVDKRTGEPVEHFGVDCNDVPSGTEHHPDGRFESSRYPGECTVCVYAPGYALATVRNVRAAEGIEPDDLLIQLVQGATLSFHVTSAATAEAIEGATVRNERDWVRNGFGETRQGQPDPSLLELRSDATGSCSTEHFPPGLYEFTVTHPEFAPKHVLVKVEQEEAQKTIEVTLREGLTIGGRVVSKAGQIPVTGARLNLLDAAGRSWVFPDAQHRSPKTDEHGAFKMERITPGDYTLCVWHDEYASFREQVHFDSRVEKGLLIEMSARGRIVVTLTTSEGAPAAGASVSHTFGEWEIDADAEGRCVFDGVDPGTFWLAAARYSGTVRETVRVLVRSGRETTVSIVFGDRAVFGTLTSGGRPAASEHVSAVSRLRPFGVASESYGWATTDEQGRYRITGLRPGVYTFTPGDRTVIVGDDDVRADVELDEIDQGHVAGVVRMPDGRPAADAIICLLPEPAGDDRLDDLARAYRSLAWWDYSDEDGEFALKDVPLGSYHFLVLKEGYAQRLITIHKKAHEDLLGLEIALERDIPVVAHVSAEGGDTPRDVRVVACNEQDRMGMETLRHVDLETSECLIYGLGPGRFTLVAQADGYAPARAEITVAEGQQTEVPFEFKRGHELTVAAHDDQGMPVPLAEAVVDSGDHVSLVVAYIKRAGPNLTDSEGRTTFKHVADGTYTVHVLAEGYEPAAERVRIAGQSGTVTLVLQRKPPPAPTTPPTSSPASSS